MFLCSRFLFLVFYVSNGDDSRAYRGNVFQLVANGYYFAIRRWYTLVMAINPLRWQLTRRFLELNLDIGFEGEEYDFLEAFGN
jgi:hypothetical protein